MQQTAELQEITEAEREAYGTDPHVLEMKSEYEIMEFIVERIAQIQSSIDAIAENAAARISKRKAFLDFLMRMWGPRLKQYAKESIEKAGLKKDGSYKRKYADLGVGKVFCRQTGGWSVDTSTLKQYLLNNPVRASEFGAQIDIRFPRGCKAGIVKHAKDTGERLPGLAYTPEDAFGTITVGATKSWTPTAASKAISAALGRTQADHFAEEEEE
jgi:hypothetical protein